MRMIIENHYKALHVHTVMHLLMCIHVYNYVTQYIIGLLYKCTCTFETSSVCVSFTVVAKVVSALEELQNNTCDKLLAFNIPVFNSHV